MLHRHSNQGHPLSELYYRDLNGERLRQAFTATKPLCQPLRHTRLVPCRTAPTACQDDGVIEVF